MTRYNLYDDGQYHGGVRLIAMRAGSSIALAQTSNPVATVEATPTREFSPSSSAFQSDQTNDYIETGLAWPRNKAVVVH